MGGFNAKNFYFETNIRRTILELSFNCSYCYEEISSLEMFFIHLTHL
jgi:hypothetical protein